MIPCGRQQKTISHALLGLSSSARNRDRPHAQRHQVRHHRAILRQAEVGQDGADGRLTQPWSRTAWSGKEIFAPRRRQGIEAAELPRQIPRGHRADMRNA